MTINIFPDKVRFTQICSGQILCKKETEKLFNERNIKGDRYLQARYIRVWLYRICIPVYKVF